MYSKELDCLSTYLKKNYYNILNHEDIHTISIIKIIFNLILFLVGMLQAILPSRFRHIRYLRKFF